MSEMENYIVGKDITPASMKQMREQAVGMLKQIVAALESDEEIDVAMVISCSIKQRPDLMGTAVIGFPGMCRHLAQTLFDYTLRLPPDPQFEPTIRFRRMP